MRFRFFFILCFLNCCAFAEKGYIPPWGKDSDLISQNPAQPNPPPPNMSPMAKLGEMVVTFHQKYITQIDGPRSHYKPSSSEYMKQSIRKHGFIKGFIMGCDRLLRENGDPWIYRTVHYDGKIFKWDPPPD
ncbi:MAG: membrane protein insertion efficiency factor YidD [Chlamydiae bacterium]|nr:membrane protein insertion efficiency factor YidD [Chlamydiota bacterium]